jgi:hypothetical protein
MADDIRETFDWLRWSVLGLLALLSLACIGAGGFLYVWIVADWLQSHSSFSGLQMIGWMAGLIAAAVVGVGFLFAGLFLRFLQWPHAPLASLLLAVFSAGFIIVTYQVFSDTGNGSDSIEVVLLQGACIAGLFAIALPPFLHWLLARRRSLATAVSKVPVK